MGTLPGQTGGVYHFWALRIRRRGFRPPPSTAYQIANKLGLDEPGHQSFALSPRDFIEGAEAFDFLGGLAFGFLTSLVERFCPLAM